MPSRPRLRRTTRNASRERAARAKQECLATRSSWTTHGYRAVPLVSRLTIKPVSERAAAVDR